MFLDKLRRKIKEKYIQNKKLLFILVLLSIIGFIAGVIFITFIAASDQVYVKEYMTSYIQNIESGNISYLSCFKDGFLSNLLLFIFIFLLGISVIGIPLIIFIYFFKSFIIGFSVTSFILSFKLKGLLYVLIYLIPNILLYILFTILVLYAIKVSIYLIYSVFHKLEMNFKEVMNCYFKIFIFSLTGIIIYSVLETFVVPHLIKLLGN